MARIKMHIPKAKLPFYPLYEVKCRLQNGVSTGIQQEQTKRDFVIEWVVKERECIEFT